jgi:hypothetical protein
MDVKVYRHIRLDKNEVFYIGIGRDNRPYMTNGRNRFWKNIVKKTEWKAEILFDDLTWEQACEKEKEFIKIYGRRDLKKGPLCNLTDGGEGVNGRIVSEEVKTKISLKNTGKKRTEEQKNKQSLSKKELFKNKENHPSFGKKRFDADTLREIAIGRKWYTNGEIDKMCYPGSEPEGFKMGRIIRKK